MFFKYVYQQIGEHTQVTIYASKSMDQTFANLGYLMMNSEEFEAFFKDKKTISNGIREIVMCSIL